ncbi:MAG: hypothetical protein COC12_09735 [Rhodobacteraceae bacterium]|nr:MAG: hypothetical protein COC12_09735 [Paracoccaceae bacterium]
MKQMISAVIGLLMLGLAPARADHRDLALFAAPVLIESGLIRFMLPRFSLKAGVGVHVEPLTPGASGGVLLHRADNGGRLAFRGQGQEFAVLQSDPDDAAARKFTAWLLSDIGQRTIAQFTPDSGAGYVGAANEQVAAPVVVLSGSAANGEKLSYSKCGRCHVIGARNRLKGIGSTPSFALLRSLDDWLVRFNEFYVRNPHPSFSQVIGVTPPFDPGRPPPISPLRLSMQDLDDIIAYTNTIEPADLGAPLVVHQ